MEGEGRTLVREGGRRGRRTACDSSLLPASWSWEEKEGETGDRSPQYEGTGLHHEAEGEAGEGGEVDLVS